MHSTSVMGTTKNMAIQTRPFDVAPVPWPRNAAGSHMAGKVALMPSNWPKKKTLVEWCVEMRQVPWGEMKGNEWYIRWDVVVPFQNFQNLGWPLTCLRNLIFQEIQSQIGRGCTSEDRTLFCGQTPYPEMRNVYIGVIPLLPFITLTPSTTRPEMPHACFKTKLLLFGCFSKLLR